MTAPAERRVLENLRNLDGARQVWTAEVAGRAGLAATVPGWWSRRRGRADGGTQWGCRPAAGDGARQARTRLARFRQLAGTAGLEITAAGRDDLREPANCRSTVPTGTDRFLLIRRAQQRSHEAPEDAATVPLSARRPGRKAAVNTYLKDVARAHVDLESRQTTGSIVLVP